MKEYVFGVDIGGTTVKMGQFSIDGNLLDKWELPTRTENGGEAILPDVARAIRAKMGEQSIFPEQVAGVGIGVPGPVGDDGTVFQCVNLGWGVFNLKSKMQELLPEIPHVAAGNDANVAALGELWQGGGRGYHSAVMITLGTGVGGGVILGGKIVAGIHGGAGEVGHMTVNRHEEEPCSCGKYGCLEQYASANGIVRLGKRMLAKSAKPSGLRDLSSFTAKEICDYAREGDAFAMEIVEACGGYLGQAMSYISCTIDPEVFIIGGGMSRAGAILIDAIARSYRRNAFHVSTDTPMKVAVLGNDAGIYGGAKMVL